MIVGAVSGWTQSTLNAKEPNPTYRTLFNMSILVITIQASGQVFQVLGGSPTGDLAATVVPLAGMALTYFIVNTVPIAIAISLTTNQNAWQIWKGDFASSFPSYLLGAIAAAVIIAVTQTIGYWLALLLMAAPLYLTYKMYRAGVEVEARQGTILEAAHDAIFTIDQNLNIREFNPAAEQMFGYARNDILGRNIALLLPPADRAPQLSAFSRYLTNGDGPLARRRLELDEPTGRRHRVPGGIDGGAAGSRQQGDHHRIRPRHHRAEAARGPAQTIAEARSDRPSGRRRRARFQQHPHEHHRIGRSDADADRPQ